MMRTCFYLLTLLLLASIPAAAQPSLVVASSGSKARVQRSQKRVWEDLQLGSKIYDNDLIETQFQTQLILQFGSSNVVVMGSNSKLLVNIEEREIARRRRPALTVTVFAGGAFLRVVEASNPVSVYSSNAVAVFDSGALSTVVEEKSGETGFQVVAGSVKIRNVKQQTGLVLTAGQTTVVFSGFDPSTPQNMTTRHVAVLKHFFGDEYVNTQLMRSGISPSDEQGAARPGRSFTEDLLAKQYVQKRAEEGVYKPPISRNRVFGRVLDIQDQERAGADEIARPPRSSNLRGQVDVSGQVALRNPGVPEVLVRPSLAFPYVGFGLRFRAAETVDRFGTPQFASTTAGYLDLLDHLDAGASLGRGDTATFHAGPIENLTIAQGLVVNHFRNFDEYSVFQPLGLTLDVTWKVLGLTAFAADAATFDRGGAHAEVAAPFATLGVGGYFDLQPLRRVTRDGARFVEFNDSGVVDKAQPKSFIYELDGGFEVLSYYSLSVTLWTDWAQELVARQNNGFALHCPNIQFEVGRLSLWAGFLYESGRFSAAPFNAVSPTNRGFLDTTGRMIPQPWLTPDRQAGAVTLSCQVNPTKGMYLELGTRLDVFDRNTITFAAPQASAGQAFFATVPGKRDSLTVQTFEGNFSLSVNDSLWKYLKYARLYARQLGGRRYPQSQDYEWWGMYAGVDILTAPIYANISVSLGGRFYLLDMNDAYDKSMPNNHIDRGDPVAEAYAGLRWEFW